MIEIFINNNDDGDDDDDDGEILDNDDIGIEREREKNKFVKFLLLETKRKEKFN